MGIGNLDLPIHDIARLLLITPHGDREPRTPARPGRRRSPHYPSWGSGTRPTRRHGHQQNELITPHGDREPGLVLRDLKLNAAHYPSWGSGTIHLAEPDIAERPLITPHGDREPQGGDLPRLPRDILITPHGDREPPAKATTRKRFPISLPLMGIGNDGQGADPSDHRKAHYPSWGSGTQPPGGGISLASSHYPSWGSGTVVLIRVDKDTDLELITPHGDRERAGGEITEVTGPQVSLPLMGIGNAGPGLGAVGVGVDLITPHGDREPLVGAVDPCRDFPSLPLMGIGNWHLVSDHGQQLELITPHGDRERTRWSRWRSNPSHSLPLMGIGNRVRHASLFGRRDLITPHGDWEHSASRSTMPG